MKDSRSIVDVDVAFLNGNWTLGGHYSDRSFLEPLFWTGEWARGQQLTKLIKAVLTLSHGSADVECGLSRSVRILGEDQALMSERVLDARLMVYDTLRLHGGKPERLLFQKNCLIWHVPHGLGINNIWMKRKKKSYPRRAKQLSKRTICGSYRRFLPTKKKK